MSARGKRRAVAAVSSGLVGVLISVVTHALNLSPGGSLVFALATVAVFVIVAVPWSELPRERDRDLPS